MSTSSNISSLLTALNIRHKSAQVDGDVLTIVFTRSFLGRDDIIPLLEVAGEVRTTLLLLHYRGVCFQVSYLDYITMLMSEGSLDSFIQRWTLDNSNL